ncbi:MAG: regulatory iron-sulfur-containing complex subunit RicT [Candidatus Zixiibacteriota bacterium]
MAELFQVEFKGSRREYFYNSYHHSLKINDYVIVQAEQGEDMGRLSKRITVEMQFDAKSIPRSILRKAGEEDLSHYRRLKADEERFQKEVVGIIKKHGLAMKVVDVECLFDGGKITFYFTADHRVDFRALVRDLASRYRTRIELRQIGVRDEARRLDGMGICGRRQCCNCHIKEFAPVSTSHARDQDLSLNPAKISGNCGRLLCCLRYEAEFYSSVKKKFPPVGAVVLTDKGSGRINRIDVFRQEAVFLNDEDVPCRACPREIKNILDTRGRWEPSMRPGEIPLDEEERRRLELLDDESSNHQ